MKLNGIMRLRIVIAGVIFLLFASVAWTILFEQQKSLSTSKHHIEELELSEQVACDAELVELEDLDVQDRIDLQQAMLAALTAASENPLAENPLSFELRGPVTVVGPDGTNYEFPRRTQVSVIENALAPIFDRSCSRINALLNTSKERLESEKERHNSVL
ncbi:MAG: hypothetical protein MRY64_06015, partial [Hyphomonadaceae bacterium]|nr:hypothetical protein [Hyphomonadaceae bacterium]